MLDRLVLQGSKLERLAGEAPDIPGAALTLLPPAAKFVFRGGAAAIEAAGLAFGVALPLNPCRFNASGNRIAFWLGPDEWMLEASGEDPLALWPDLSKGLAGCAHSLVDVSHRSNGFALSGPKAAYVLNHGCPLDLSPSAFPAGMCTRTVFAKAPVMLSRPSLDRFNFDVSRSFAPYVWQFLDDARRELRSGGDLASEPNWPEIFSRPSL